MQNIERRSKNIDIVINTIPHLVVTANVISKMPAHTLVMIWLLNQVVPTLDMRKKRSQSAVSTWIARYCCSNSRTNFSECSFSVTGRRRNRKKGEWGMNLKREKNRVWFYWFPVRTK